MSAPSIAAQRALFERVEGLAEGERQRLYAAEGVDRSLIDAVERLLVASQQVDTDPARRRLQQSSQVELTRALPSRIGPWQVVGLLGEGGMGIVLKARRADGEYQREVAIKLVQGMSSGRLRERFRRERELLARLQHPNIAGLLDAGSTESGEPYLVMPLVEGVLLGEWLRERSPALGERLRLILSLCRAVHFAHQHLIVHRDIKPGNVMVGTDGHPVLLDFGIAKLLEEEVEERTVTRLLTPRYASPEQLLGQLVTTATDVHALGLLMFELLCGDLPLRADGLVAAGQELPAASAYSRERGSALGVGAGALRGDLDRIIHRAVRLDPQSRYPSALALAEDIEAFLAGRPVAAAGRHRLYLLRRFVQRHRYGVAASLVAALTLAGTALQWKQERDRALVAEASAREEAEAARRVTEYLETLFAELDPNLHPGRELSARELLEIGRERIPEASSAGLDLRARLQTTLGQIYAHAGETDAAIKLLESAREALVETAAENTEQRAARLRLERGLARAYNLAGRFEEAAPLAERVHAALIDGSASDRKLAAHALMECTVARESLGQSEIAMHCLEQAEALFREAESTRDLAVVQHNRAWITDRAGRYADALPLWDRAIEALRLSLGERHPLALDAMLGRAKTLSALGRFAEVAASVQALLPQIEQVTGPESEPMARALIELASALQDLGEAAGAEAAYRRNLVIERKLAGGRPSVNLGVGLNNLASLMEESGREDEARALYGESLQVRRAALPSGHLSQSTPLHNLARLWLAAGDAEKAAPLLAEALQIRSTVLEPTHPNVLASRLLGVQIAARSGDLARARTELESMSALLDEGDLKDLSSLQANRQLTRAVLAEAADNPAERAEALRMALVHLQSSFTDDHPRIAAVWLELAEAELALARPQQARELLSRSAPILSGRLAPEARLRQRLLALEQQLAAAP